ncbi:response regulator receiver domain-containing protein [Cecembia rubra]|uniref:Response regulator receiver domain-containing protein n=3 Tax=Cecembia rubra TaxID=1485585 RepID=A0A2P8E4E5_9BACT|nr:response regulator receiver domain-containing protein [Cecembia rubra]
MNMKFLIVDDERDVEILFRQKLRREVREGMFELEFAFSGNEALEILRNHYPPEVMYIFSDINMPGMTGLELLDKVKAEFPDIQVSMISAYGDKENHDKAMNSGAKEFFTKPVDFDTIKAEIHQILSR